MANEFHKRPEQSKNVIEAPHQIDNYSQITDSPEKSSQTLDETNSSLEDSANEAAYQNAQQRYFDYLQSHWRIVTAYIYASERFLIVLNNYFQADSAGIDRKAALLKAYQMASAGYARALLAYERSIVMHQQLREAIK